MSSYWPSSLHWHVNTILLQDTGNDKTRCVPAYRTDLGMHYSEWASRQEPPYVPAFSSSGRRVLQVSQGEAFLPVSEHLSTVSRLYYLMPLLVILVFGNSNWYTVLFDNMAHFKAPKLRHSGAQTRKLELDLRFQKGFIKSANLWKLCQNKKIWPCIDDCLEKRFADLRTIVWILIKFELGTFFVGADASLN